jgi:hypothetical protein
LEEARDEGCVGYGAGRREGGPSSEILAGGPVAVVYGVRLSIRVMRARHLRGWTWVRPGGRVGDDLQTRNDQITLCERKILWVEKMGGNFKHHNIALLLLFFSFPFLFLFLFIHIFMKRFFCFLFFSSCFLFIFLSNIIFSVLFLLCFFSFFFYFMSFICII